jgi:uncharacterized protein (UPF0276 family)
VGLQLNHTLFTPVLDLQGIEFAFAELLCDQFAGPIDSGYDIEPEARPVLELMRGKMALLAHGNFGAEFGFDRLEDCRAVRRHLAVARAMGSPYYCDHMFFGDRASSFMWSSPLQFSPPEVERVVSRAAKLQDLLKMPLIHENAFYYAPFAGSTLAEADFVSQILERADTGMLLDLHNVFSNSVNFPDYDRWAYLRTIPLERVIEIHLAGGQWIDGWYHDFHNNPVPEEVWAMLDWVLARAPNVKAICLEVQSARHCARASLVTPAWRQMIANDLGRARRAWNHHRSNRAADRMAT